MTLSDADRRRQILEQVASGAMTPSEAADRLAALDALAEHEAATAKEAAGGHEPTTAPASASVQRVKVSCAFRSVSIVGDPTVREAVADGDHEARIEGDTLLIDGDTGLDGLPAAFAFAGSGGGMARAQRVVRMQGKRVRPLVVRMNPALALDVDVSAGSLSIAGVHGAINATCAAGSVRIDGFAAPLDLNVSAGSVTARGRLDRGESRIQCDAGKVALELERDSSVRITTRVNLGKVSFGRHGDHKDVRGTGSDEHVVGTGSGRLEISCNLGAVQVDVNE